jgi:hypothetical protein
MIVERALPAAALKRRRAIPTLAEHFICYIG